MYVRQANYLACYTNSSTKSLRLHQLSLSNQLNTIKLFLPMNFSRKKKSKIIIPCLHSRLFPLFSQPGKWKEDEEKAQLLAIQSFK